MRSLSTPRSTVPDGGAAGCSALPRFEHQEGARRAEADAGIGPGPEIGEPAAQQEAAGIVGNLDIRARSSESGADQENFALACGEAAMGDAQGVGASGLFAHEGPARTGDLVNDRDVAGEQIGQLRQEQGRAQAVGQLRGDPILALSAIGMPGRALENLAVQIEIALAAAGGDDHMGPLEQFRVALEAGHVEREPGGVGAVLHHRPHGAPVAGPRHLGRKVVVADGVDRERRGRGLVDPGAAGGRIVERRPPGLRRFAERRKQAVAGDANFAIRHVDPPPGPANVTGAPISRARAITMSRNSGFGNGMVL